MCFHMSSVSFICRGILGVVGLPKEHSHAERVFVACPERLLLPYRTKVRTQWYTLYSGRHTCTQHHISICVLNDSVLYYSARAYTHDKNPERNTQLNKTARLAAFSRSPRFTVRRTLRSLRR